MRLLSTFLLTVVLAGSAFAAEPTALEAERFVVQAEERLAPLVLDVARTQWVQNNFITSDTQALAAAANAKLTPASPKWADVEAARVLQDFFVQLASGGDAAALATELDTKIEDILNG